VPIVSGAAHNLRVQREVGAQARSIRTAWPTTLPVLSDAARTLRRPIPGPVFAFRLIGCADWIVADNAALYV